MTVKEKMLGQIRKYDDLAENYKANNEADLMWFYKNAATGVRIKYQRLTAEQKEKEIDPLEEN